MDYARSVIGVFFKHYPQQKERLQNFIWKHGDFEVDLPDTMEVIPLMNKVNQEVKHPTCPHNLRNRFYSRKHRVINLLMASKRIDSIIESTNLYKFVVGDYSFHQLKAYFPSGLSNIDGTEEYVPEKHDIPFNEDDFKKFCLAFIALKLEVEVLTKI